MLKIGFIGAGNMGGALAISAARALGGKEVMITDHHADKMEALQEKTGCVIAKDADDIAANCEYIVLGMKPDGIRKAARGVAPILRSDCEKGIRHIIVSIAAGVSTDAIRECIGDGIPVLRLMPNTPVAVGEGMILMTANDTDFDELDKLRDVFSAAGELLYIPESKFDDFSSISGYTPAYAYMFIQSLADGAVKVGVPRKLATHLAAQTVLGSARMILETGEHPDKLKDDVCSPGGSTIEGVAALEEGAFRGTVAQAIVASAEKSKKLGK